MSGRVELSRSFGRVAEEYDRWRPGYPDEVIDWVVERVKGTRAAEIGAGTGKATVGFLRAGLEVTAVEPDPAMAAVGRARVPSANWIVAAAETWEPDAEFDLIYGAQSWHWVPDEADARLARALGRDGVMAWLWNHPSLGVENELLGDIYARHMPDSEEGVRIANHRRDPSYWRERLGVVVSDVETLEVPWERALAAEDYVSLIGTYSDHIALAHEDRRQLQQAIRQRLDSYGGSITVEYLTRVYLGHRPER